MTETSGRAGKFVRTYNVGTLYEWHDPDHSESEDRFVLLGMSSALRLLVVCHYYRADGDVIRIISARRADLREQKDYSERWRR